MRASNKEGLRVWTKADLQRENLDFTFILRRPLPEAIAAWYWELDRELGTVIEPFVERPRPRRASASESPNHEAPVPLGIKYYKLGSLLPWITSSTDSLSVCGPSRSRIHAFEINWEMPWPQVVAAFKAWGEQQSSYRSRYESSGEPYEPYDPYDPDDQLDWPATGRGRKDFCYAWLNDLRVYRIKSAGLTFKEGFRLLKETDAGPQRVGRQQREKIVGPDIEIDPAKWSNAIRRARRRISLYRFVVDSLPGPICSHPGSAQSQPDRVPPNTELAWRLLEYFAKPWIDSHRGPASFDCFIPGRAWDGIHNHPIARTIVRIKPQAPPAKAEQQGGGAGRRRD
jgi:hypothetical protein